MLLSISSRLPVPRLSLPHSVFKKVINASLAGGLSSLKSSAASCASPSWRAIAFSRDNDPRSCMKRALVRKPQSGAVLNLFAVSCGPTWTRSPVHLYKLVCAKIIPAAEKNAAWHEIQPYLNCACWLDCITPPPAQSKGACDPRSPEIRAGRKCLYRSGAVGRGLGDIAEDRF
jgi:hypothetical protein